MLQLGDQGERAIVLHAIADKVAEGWPPGEICRELSTNLPEQVAARPNFIAARLKKMAPRVPTAGPAPDAAVLNEINARKAAWAGTAPPSAAEARAAMAASRDRARARKTQQGKDMGPA